MNAVTERIVACEQRVEPVREIQPQADNVPNEALEPTESDREPIFEDEDLEQEEVFEMSMQRRNYEKQTIIHCLRQQHQS